MQGVMSFKVNDKEIAEVVERVCTEKGMQVQVALDRKTLFSTWYAVTVRGSSSNLLVIKDLLRKYFNLEV